MRKTNRKQTGVKGTEERRVVEFFCKHGQFLLPMIELVEQSRAAIDEMIDVVGRGAVEAVLQLSAQELSGAKSQGRKVERANEVRWHGRQWGSVALSDRKLRVERPRLRDREGEVAIPAYAALQDDGRLSGRMLELLLSGVSTRDYQKVIREMAETAGVSKSSVSREFVEESVVKLQELNERLLPAAPLLIVYLDGMV
jgi:putative transposase